MTHRAGSSAAKRRPRGYLKRTLHPSVALCVKIDRPIKVILQGANYDRKSPNIVRLTQWTEKIFIVKFDYLVSRINLPGWFWKMYTRPYLLFCKYVNINCVRATQSALLNKIEYNSFLRKIFICYSVVYWVRKFAACLLIGQLVETDLHFML